MKAVIVLSLKQFIHFYGFCSPGNGFARFILIDQEDSYDRSSIAKKIQLPWKTDAIKGILKVSDIKVVGTMYKKTLVH